MNTLYIAACQFLTVAVHGSRALAAADTLTPAATGELTYPALILLVIGVYRHRARVRRWGGEASWSA